MYMFYYLRLMWRFILPWKCSRFCRKSISLTTKIHRIRFSSDCKINGRSMHWSGINNNVIAPRSRTATQDSYYFYYYYSHNYGEREREKKRTVRFTKPIPRLYRELSILVFNEVYQEMEFFSSYFSKYILRYEKVSKFLSKYFFVVLIIFYPLIVLCIHKDDSIQQ